MVTAILSYKCGPELAALTVGTIAAYTAFTFSVTQWRTQFRCARRGMLLVGWIDGGGGCCWWSGLIDVRGVEGREPGRRQRPVAACRC